MRLPRYIASTAVRETGLVRAQDIGALTNVGVAEFQAIERAGRAIGAVSDLGARAYMSRQAIDDEIEAGKATQRIQESWNKVEDTIDNYVPDIDMPLPDDPNYNKTLTTLSKTKTDEMLLNFLKDVDKDANTIFKNVISRRTRERLITRYNDQYAENVKKVKSSLSAKLDNYQYGEILNLASAAARNGNAEGANHYIDVAEQHGLITHTRAIALKVEYENIAKKSLIDNIKPLLIDAINAGDKDSGYDMLNVAMEALVDDGSLTNVEAADANKTLGDWMDNYVAGREKKAEDAIKLTTRQTYQEFSKLIPDGDLTYDDIENSALLKADKEKWKVYIKGSYEGTPVINSPKGLEQSLNAVFDAAMLKESPTDAYDILLDIRFSDRSITDSQFGWAVDKIENPYPRPVMEDLRASTKINYDFDRLLYRDKSRNRDANEMLIAWTDDQIEDGKTPTQKEMNARSRQFRVGLHKWFDVGDVIERGGREYEVVGFDESDEPIMEEIE